MKRIWMIPVILAAGLTGFGGLAHAQSAQDAGWRDGPGYSRDDDGRDEYGGRRWHDDDRYDDNRGPRWRDGRDDDRRGYGAREGRHGYGDRCGPRGRGEYGWRHRERGYDRDRGDGWRDGRRFDRDDSDRGYRRHGHQHRHEGRDGPRRFGGGFDAARLDSVKRELGVTAAQEEVWTNYTATLKEVADARKARRDSMDRGAIARMSPEEHRTFRDGMIEQRRKEQDQVNAAVDALVKSLDEKQVAIAKEMLPGYAFGRFMHMGMGMGGGRYR